MNDEVKKRFFLDPQWYLMEQMILDFINPLLDMKTINIKQPAEHVKAEVIARGLSYNSLIGFVRSSGMVSDKRLLNKENIFK